jgi:hypothetical protein
VSALPGAESWEPTEVQLDPVWELWEDIWSSVTDFLTPNFVTGDDLAKGNAEWCRARPETCTNGAPNLSIAGVPNLSGAGATAVAAAAAAGRYGDQVVRNAFTIGRSTKLIINGRSRFPDGVLPGVITEIKNVAYQGWTRQLRDYPAAAQGRQAQFDLYVRLGNGTPGSGTTLSPLLLQAMQQGLVNVIPFIRWP